ncbi:MAG: SAM-dependent methyltransferase, partial [Pseudomonadota bacterium]
MTPLEGILSREIVQTGPISTARYMDLCLSHPQHGYYTTRDPLGTGGDFTTAPEISQMFGEMLGVWVATVWAGMGKPDFTLVELGPGRGTLMADVLRVLRPTGAAPDIWLVETSPTLRAEQARRVPEAHLVERLEDVPEGPMILLANEFFDALPVHQYLRTPQGWREQQVGLVDGKLSFGLSEPVPDRETPLDWLEVSPAADNVTEQIAARLNQSPGAALIIDYGYVAKDTPPGLTLQALRNHD